MRRDRENDERGRVEQPEIRLGFVPLTDCAPLVIARERGFFRREGIEVELARELSWANVRDKLAVGAIEGAQLLAPMSLSTSLGIDGFDLPLVVPLCLDLNGNAITISTELAKRLEHGAASGADARPGSAWPLRAVIEEDRRLGRPPLVFAVVFPFSSHNYLLRYWLAAAGIDPDRDVRILVAPPPSMVAMLQQGSIDGYCVGEPWNTLAHVEGVGRTWVTGLDVCPGSPEKVLAVRRDWAEDHPRTVRAMTRALIQACRWLDDPANRQEAVHVIAGQSFVDAPVDVVAASMLGRMADGSGRVRSLPDMHVFYRYAATFPWRSHGAWLVAQMLRWGQLEKLPDVRGVLEDVYRPDIYREVAAELNVAVPSIDWKTEGTHPDAWILEEADVPIPMCADRFVDHAIFDPNDLRGYLEGFEISSLRVRLDEMQPPRPGDLLG